MQLRYVIKEEFLEMVRVVDGDTKKLSQEKNS